MPEASTAAEDPAADAAASRDDSRSRAVGRMGESYQIFEWRCGDIWDVISATNRYIADERAVGASQR